MWDLRRQYDALIATSLGVALVVGGVFASALVPVAPAIAAVWCCAAFGFVMVVLAVRPRVLRFVDALPEGGASSLEDLRVGVWTTMVAPAVVMFPWSLWSGDTLIFAGWIGGWTGLMWFSGGSSRSVLALTLSLGLTCAVGLAAAGFLAGVALLTWWPAWELVQLAATEPGIVRQGWVSAYAEPVAWLAVGASAWQMLAAVALYLPVQWRIPAHVTARMASAAGSGGMA